MATSRVPYAVDALLAILRAASALTDVHIEDGPPSVNLTTRDRIYIGWQPGGENAVSLEQDFSYAGARRRDENFTIACYAESRMGDKAMELPRTRVFELVAAVEDALRGTEAAPTAPTLSGTVMWAHLVTGDLTQVQGEGALAGLAFGIACHAQI